MNRSGAVLAKHLLLSAGCVGMGHVRFRLRPEEAWCPSASEPALREDSVDGGSTHIIPRLHTLGESPASHSSWGLVCNEILGHPPSYTAVATVRQTPPIEELHSRNTVLAREQLILVCKSWFILVHCVSAEGLHWGTGTYFDSATPVAKSPMETRPETYLQNPMVPSC